MQTWKIIARGIVQGVGFRYSVQMYAQKLGLNGTVRNNADSTVTILLQANEKQVDYFMNHLAENISSFAKIRNLEKEELAKQPKMHGFHVVY